MCFDLFFLAPHPPRRGRLKPIAFISNYKIYIHIYVYIFSRKVVKYCKNNYKKEEEKLDALIFLAIDCLSMLCTTLPPQNK